MIFGTVAGDIKPAYVELLYIQCVYYLILALREALSCLYIWKVLLDIRLEAYSEIPSRFWQTYSIYLSIVRVWSRFDRIRKNFGRTLALGLGTAYLM